MATDKKNRKKEKRNAPPKDPVRVPPEQQQGPPPKDGTEERPKPPTCGCQTTIDIYTQIGSLPPQQQMSNRIRITLESIVGCDPATPDHCYYQYIATAEVQRLRPRQGVQPASWVTSANRKAFFQSFTVHDDVNKTERPDTIDQSRLEMGEWFKRAPQKEKTRVTLELAASIRGGWRTTINREVEMCVPKLDTPKCPE